MLTTAQIQCNFYYASASWFSGLSQKNKSKCQVLQNKVVRYLLNLTPRTHVGVNELKCVNMLPVNYRGDQLNWAKLPFLPACERPTYHWHTVEGI